jgi:hypothetical protein
VTSLGTTITEMKTCRARMTSQLLRIKMKIKTRIKMKRAVSLKNPHANVERPQFHPFIQCKSFMLIKLLAKAFPNDLELCYDIF